MLRLAVLVSGGGTNLQAILGCDRQPEVITNAEVVKVISNSRKAYALERAAAAGIPTVCVTRREHPDAEDFDAALLAELQEAQADLVVLAGCLVVISQRHDVNAYPNRIINIHPALIPSFCGTGYYGLGVHEAALARGVRVTGATVHFVDGGTDTGPIILQKAVEVKQNDTAKELQLRVMQEAEWVILPKAIDLIANGRVTVENGQVKIAEA